MIFVTANLKGCRETRQGWLLKSGDGFIIGESGAHYEIEGEVAVVTNPPCKPSKEAIAAIGIGERPN
ncbi:hypothetical protein [Vreelandella glaciei]|uniref:hypothetical protein n=1 Tax=Vreelandella glaciei TaxID=186761 RepID=UPI0030EB17C9|tara:strand:- start:12074 stop:12274 length:201 start_codon:yes stop_codon:yes gene_type:complete